MPDSIFHRVMEKLPISAIKMIFNFWPPFRGAGIKVNKISPDFRSFDVTLRTRLLNRNYMGVHYGASLFSMVDPFYVIILIKNLGSEYIVWDKAGKIDFKKPERGIIKAHCSFSEEKIADIRKETNRLGKYIFDQSVDLKNNKNEVVATVTKTLYVKRKEKYSVAETPKKNKYLK